MAIDGGMRGKLVAGTKLIAQYKGKQYTAEVVAGEDGKLRFRLDDGREAVEHVTAAPITRSRFADGGFSPDFDGDNEGVMVLRCKGCQRVGPVGARFEVLRDGPVEAGDGVRRERFIE